MMFRQFRTGENERGAALLTVMGTMVFLSALLLIGLTTAVRNIDTTRKSQLGDGATSAAQAGVDNYLQQLNIDVSFLGNVGTWSGYIPIQGSNGTDASYRYRVISINGAEVVVEIDGVSQTGGGGTTASGQHKSVFATLRIRSFLNYVYFSDIEVIDPALINGKTSCGTYYYTGRSSISGCSEIQWASGDVVNGPLHSNDALQINGTVRFKDVDTSTSWPATTGKDGKTNTSKTWWGTQSAPLPEYAPVYDQPLVLPSTNSKLLTNVKPDITRTEAQNGIGNINGVPSSTRVGCYYQGATRIIFQGTTMKVLSPATNRKDTPTSCYNVAAAGTEQTVTIPPVIYVDSATASCSLGNVGFPLSNEAYTTGTATATSWGNGPNYSCKRGTVYIQGVADTAVTVSSTDDTVITGNLTAQDITSSSTDVIGIIAGNYVWVYHPVTSSGANILSILPLASPKPPAHQVNTINAGILAIGHSFVVQNWGNGATLGILNVTGAIAQKFRGPVGTSNSSGAATGYLKNYVHDARMGFYLRPPYFIEPANTWDLVKTVAK